MTAWKKRYSFRLKETETELIRFLEDVPNTKRSEVIRQMLMFAYRQMTTEQKEQKQFQMLNEKIQEMKNDQTEQMKGVIQSLQKMQETIEKGGVPAPSSQKDADNQMTDEAVKQSAESLLSSFGVES